MLRFPAHTPTKNPLQQRSLCAYPNVQQELTGLLANITRLIHAGTPPQRIALLYTTPANGSQLATLLHQQQIPCNFHHVYTLHEIPALNNTILSLQYLSAELTLPTSGENTLFELLHASNYHIPNHSIAQLCINAHDKKRKKNSTLRQQLRELTTHPATDLFAPPVPPGIIRLSTNIETWLKNLPDQPLTTLLQNIIEAYAPTTGSPENIAAHTQSQLLLELAQQVQTQHPGNANQQLPHLLARLPHLQTTPHTQSTGDQQGIRLLPALNTTSIPFDHTFFPGHAIAPSKQSSSTTKTHHEDLLQLLDTTPPGSHLILSWAQTSPSGQPQQADSLVNHFRIQYGLPIENYTLPANPAIICTPASTIPPSIPPFPNSFIEPLLKRFVMNVTALNNYLQCPLQFLHQSLLRASYGKSEQASFGIAIHHALHHLFEQMQTSPDKKTFPSKDTFINGFTQWMNNNQPQFNPETFAHKKQYGQQLLSNLYDRKINTWHTITIVERMIKTQIEDIPIKGQLDKLEFNGRQVNVVDYKSGNPQKALARLQPPSATLPNGGEYWRQAVFYKLLVEHYPQKKWTVTSTEFDFLEPDHTGAFLSPRITITAADATTVKEQIRSVWRHIQNQNFYTGCGKPGCFWCTLMHRQQQPDPPTTSPTPMF